MGVRLGDVCLECLEEKGRKTKLACLLALGSWTWLGRRCSSVCRQVRSGRATAHVVMVRPFGGGMGDGGKCEVFVLQRAAVQRDSSQ